MNTVRRYPAEVKERAVRLVFKSEARHDSLVLTREEEFGPDRCGSEAFRSILQDLCEENRMNTLPSDGELEILRVLWALGPCTVGDVHDRVRRTRSVEYNTIGKLLQIMTEKGLVEVDDQPRAHVFSAAVEQAEVQGRLTEDLAERAFGGSAAQLALRALSREPLTAEEAEELRQVLDRLENGD